MRPTTPPKQRAQHPLMHYKHKHVFVQLRSPVSISGVVIEQQGNFVKMQDADIKGTLQEKSVEECWIDLNCLQHFHPVA